MCPGCVPPFHRSPRGSTRPVRGRRVASRLPDRPFWDLVNRGEDLLYTDPEMARASFEAAVSLRGDDYLAQFYLGYAQEASRRLEPALTAYRRANALPGADARVSSRMARVLLHLRKIEEAEDALQEGLRREPGYSPVLAKLLEIAWDEQRDAARALPYCERLLDAVPDNGDLLFKKGLLLFKLNRSSEALEAFGWAAHLDGPPEAHLYSGQILRETGDLRRAIEALERYASLAKDTEAVAMVRTMIESIRQEEAAER